MPSHQWGGKVEPFDRWGLDLIGLLPRTPSGNCWLITAVDYATRWPIAKAVPNATSSVLADFVHNDIYMHYGAPKEIITDRGRNLWAPAMKEFLEKLKTVHRSTTPYHPQTNSLVENFNRTISHMLTKYLVGKPRQMWDQYVDQALFAIRIRTHSTTRQSPFYLLYGCKPRLPTDDSGPELLNDATRDDPGLFLETARAEALQLTEERAITNQEAWDKLMIQRTFDKDEWVLVQAENTKKWEGKWFGPYKITKTAPLNTYELRTPNGRKMPRLINGERLRKARVEGRVTRGWRLPRNPGCRRLHGSENNPEHAVAAPLDQFEPLPEEDDDVRQSSEDPQI